MSITPHCDKCKKELVQFGAILLSPPDEKNQVTKFHICRPCYEVMVRELSGTINS